VQVTPASTDPIAMMQAMFQIFQQMQPKSDPSQPVVPVSANAPVGTAAPVPPVATSDPMATMQQMFQIFQQMHASVPPPAPPPAPPPTVQVVPPAVDPMVMMKQMFGMFQQMQEAMRPAPPAPPERGPFTGPYRPPDGDLRDPPMHRRTDHDRPTQPLHRPQTPSEQLRDAVNVVRSTMEIAREFSGAPPEPQPEPEEDDSPVRVIDMGPAKGVINRSDGSLRGFETAMANLPDILGWFGKQAEAVRKAKAEERRQQQPQLPPGFVYAGPDYQPPEGFVAVPIDQIPQQAHPSQPVQAPLPEPPEEMPPPIAESEPRQRSGWGMPPARPGQG